MLKRIYKQLPKAEAFEAISDYDNKALGFAAAADSVAAIADAAVQMPALEHVYTESVPMLLPIALSDMQKGGNDEWFIFQQRKG